MNNTTDPTRGFASCAGTDFCTTYYFTEDNCQGTAYFATSTAMVQDAVVIDDVVQYPAGVVSSRAFRSFR